MNVILLVASSLMLGVSIARTCLSKRTIIWLVGSLISLGVLIAVLYSMAAGYAEAVPSDTTKGSSYAWMIFAYNVFPAVFLAGLVTAFITFWLRITLVPEKPLKDDPSTMTSEISS